MRWDAQCWKDSRSLPLQQAAHLQSLHIPDAQLHFCSSFVDLLAVLIVFARGDDFNILLIRINVRAHDKI